MKDINLYGLGGTGVNILNLFSKEGMFKDRFNMISLDTSDANPVNGEDISSMRLEVPKITNEDNGLKTAEGSGGDRGKYIKEYPDFLKKALARFEPNRLNILVYSVSGGTGSGMGPILHRFLLEKKLPVISVIVGDTGSIKEANNTISGVMSLNQQTTLGHPVVFCYYDNGQNGATQGSINKNICYQLDCLSVLFNPKNKRIDQSDINNFFYFNSIINSSPVLTELMILNPDTITTYDKNVVAAIGLYKNEDSIKQEFNNLLYRKVGIFDDMISEASPFDFLYAVLDHGDSLRRLESMVQDQRKINDSLAGVYQTENKLLKPEDKDGLGFVDFQF